MAAITTAAIGAGVSAYTIANAEKQKKDAKRALNGYERQSLDNAFDNVQISTLGSDLLREDGARTSATMVDSLQNGGSRAIIGGLPKVASYTNEIEKEAAKLLDRQFIEREYARAGDEVAMRGIKENRDINNINAISSTYNAGQQNSQNGILGLGSSLAYGARNIDFRKGTTPPSVPMAGRTGTNGLVYDNPQPTSSPYFDLTTPYNVPDVKSTYTSDDLDSNIYKLPRF